MAQCRTLMSEAIKNTPGVRSIQFDRHERTVVWRYRADELPGGVLPTEELRRELEKNLTSCPLREDFRSTRCHSCQTQSHKKHQRNASGYLKHLAGEGVITAVTEDLPLTIETFQGVESFTQTLTPAEVSQEELTQLQADSECCQGESIWQKTRKRIKDAPWEMIAVGLTVIATVAGAVIEHRRGMSTAAWGAYMVAYLFGGYFGLREGLSSLAKRTLDIDLLMILAAVGAAIIGAPFEGALLLFLFSLSNVLQDFALNRTKNAIRALMRLRPARAEVIRDGNPVVIPVEGVTIGEVFVVRPGGRVPLDGEIVEGSAEMDEALLTGESLPIHKGVGETVLAGSINTNGSLSVRTTHTSSDSTIAKIIRLVESAQAQKAKTERFLETFERYYTLFVIALTVAFATVPLFLFGEAFSSAFYRAITVMVAASPCALIISTPASVLSAIGAGARRGVLFKGGVYVERAGTVRAIAFDKTGTLTYGKPEVTDVVSLTDQISPQEVLSLSASIERHSEHALAQAVVNHATERGAALYECKNFRSVAGRGVEAQTHGFRLRLGSPAYFDDLSLTGHTRATEEITRLWREKKTVIAVAELDSTGAGRYLGLIALADKLRPNAKRVISELHRQGIERVIMLTGDNDATAQAIAREAGVDETYAELTPEAKLEAIQKIESQYGVVAMIGDGVNDAPALARASLGIAMGAGGTDVALETADVVLMADELEQIPFLITLSRKTRRTLIFNLGLALTLIVAMITSIVAIDLPLPLAVIGHEGGTVLVSLNGMRLLLFGGGKLKKHRL